MKRCMYLLMSVILMIVTHLVSGKDSNANLLPTMNDKKWFFLKQEDITTDNHNTLHAKIFGKYTFGYNLYILQGIDKTQSHAMDGGGYFMGIHAIPEESPIGYDLSLFGKKLLNPPRTSSYCSGATYTAFIEGLNLIYADGAYNISDKLYEAMRMQERNGARREDNVKYWGYWNASGFGSEMALVQYSHMGVDIKPQNARPGDFMNISWRKGGGHSVIFLGWYKDNRGRKYIKFWSSQLATNGMGDRMISLHKIQQVKIVRLTKPDNLFFLRVQQSVNSKIAGDSIHFD